MSTLREAAQQLLEAWSRRDYEIGKYMDALRAALAKEAEPTYTTGHCKEKAKAGGCPLHNLQCGYPECDRKPAAQQAEPDAKAYATRLAVAIWRKHYRQIAPQWKPLDDLIGVLSQIDNMTAGMQLTQQAEPSRTQRMRDAGYTRRPAVREMTAQTPCDIAEDGVCEVIDCCRNPKQAEPVAWANKDDFGKFDMRVRSNCDHYHTEPLYAAPSTPPQRKPLTEKELEKIMTSLKSPSGFKGWWWQDVARAIERAHGIGGDDGQA